MSFLSLVLISLSFSLQTAATPKSVPVADEPRHHIRFENKYIRVIEAIVEPGDTTLYHTHSRDNVPIAIGAATLRTTLLGSTQSADSNVEVGRTTWAAATYTHQIKNLGKTRIHYIDAELVSSPGQKSEATLTGVPGHTLVFENEKVRAYRVIVQPGQSIASHKHGLPYLNVSVSGGELVIEGPDKKSSKQKFRPGAFAWFDGTSTHALKNTGTAPYEMIDLELK